MIRTTRPLRTTLLTALLCGVSSLSLFAQGPVDGPEHHHHGPPSSPLFDALDTNHDGVLSAEEIANASASLKALLKDGATELKREDLRPTPPPHHDPAGAQAASDNDHPRGKVPMIRPHGPPPQADAAQNDAPEEATPPAPPKPDDAPPEPRPEMADHHHHPAPDDVMEADPRGFGPEHRHHPGPNEAMEADPRDHGPEHHHQGPPSNPLFDALDTNHDGVISSEEMDKATGAIKELLKPGTTELRREDLRPMPPHHPEDGRP